MPRQQRRKNDDESIAFPASERSRKLTRLVGCSRFHRALSCQPIKSQLLIAMAQKPSGEPYYVLNERARRELGGRRVHLSLTHDRERAMALCICEE